MEQHSNPMGWARTSPEKVTFKPTPQFNLFEENLCSRLSQIFVDQMGLAKQISLEIDPKTGDKILEFLIDKNSTIPDQLIEQEISGIPIRFTYTSPLK